MLIILVIANFVQCFLFLYQLIISLSTDKIFTLFISGKKYFINPLFLPGRSVILVCGKALYRPTLYGILAVIRCMKHNVLYLSFCRSGLKQK